MIARVLITGVNGFVGPYLKDACRAAGWELQTTWFTATGEYAPDKDETSYQLNVTDREAVFKTVLASRPDFVCHLAGFSSVKASWEHPELCRKVNVEGTRNLLDALRTHAPGAKILIVSSAEVYGIPQELPITEEHPLMPTSPYGKSRKEQEELAKQYPDLHIVISRSFNHIGPGQQRGFVIADFCAQIAAIEKGAPPVIKAGDLAVRRDFTDVRDVVQAYVLLLKKAKANPTCSIYNVCSNAAPTLRENVDLLLSLSRAKDIRVEQDRSLVRPVEIPELRGSNEKIGREVGWRPSIEIRETLQNTLEDWRHARTG
jgi:GDP-4-dehydro-6-deoxy-D-mannose reductase